MEIYNRVRTVPREAKKPIKGGRISGMTDINPMWRIQVLTETFGMCGFGWKYEITNKHLEQGANDEISGFVDINLYVKHEGEWSAPIPGTGGSSFVAKEKNGMYTSDEVYKMALTDALSVACKALGIGADVYWQEGSKYTNTAPEPTTEPETKIEKINPSQAKQLVDIAKGGRTELNEVQKMMVENILKKYGYRKAMDISKADFANICWEVKETLKKAG